MEGGDPPAEVELLGRRLDVIDRFAAGPSRKRDVVDDLDCSRSTLDRAVRRLTEAGLLERTAEGYVTSLAGRLAADRYRSFLADERAVLDRAGVLSALPVDADMPIAMLRDATVETAGEDPYALVERVLDDLRAADRYDAVLPRLTDTRHLRLCHARVVRDALRTRLVSSPDLIDRLRREFPRLAARLVDAATVDVATADLPEFGLIVADDDEATEVTVLAYDDDGGLAAIVRNDGEAVVEWARERVADLAATGEAATERLQPESAVTHGDPPLAEPAALSDEGVVRLDPSYFANRVPNDPAAGWRAGFDLVDVYYGHALDRTAPAAEGSGRAAPMGERDADDGPLGTGRAAPAGEVAGPPTDAGTPDEGSAEARGESERQSLVASLFDRLRTDGHQVVIGPPGTGKSTLCRAVACRWVDAGIGDVLYRNAPTVGGLERVGPLVDAVERDDGHTLVVVEDATEAGVTAAVAQLVDRYRDDGAATVLLEAREDAWAEAVERVDPDSGPVGRDDLAAFEVPGVDEVECRRAIDAFEAATGRSVSLSAADLHARLREVPGVGDLYLLGFHLTAVTDPDFAAESKSETALDAAVTALYDKLTGRVDGNTTDGTAGNVAFVAEVGVLVATLTAAGLTVTPDVVHAIAADRDGSPDDPARSPHLDVERALDRLTGRMLFANGDGPAYRTHHPYWGVRFLERAADRDERRARSLFERALSSLFALADDSNRRERIEDWLGRDSKTLAEFDDSDAVSDVTESIAGLAVRHSRLMPLFGTTERSGIDLPAVASPRVDLSWTSARLVGWHDQGGLDRAVAEAELLLSTAPAATDLDEDERKAYVVTAHRRLGEIAEDRGDVDAAREQYRAAIEVAQEVDEDRTEIRARTGLAWLELTLDEYDRARDHLTTALELADEEASRARTTARYYMGMLELFRGDYAAADSHLQQAREFDRELGDRQGESATLHSLGRVAAEQGDYDRAEQHYRRSLALNREAGMRDAAAETRVALADLLIETGALERASTHAEEAFETLDELGNERDRGDALVVLGRLERERDNLTTAREYYRRARSCHASVDHDRGMAAADLGLGDVEHEASNHDAAVERHEAAYERFVDIAAPGKALDAVDRLVTVARERGNLATAMEWCETGRDLATEAGLETRRDQLGDRYEELTAEATRRE